MSDSYIIEIAVKTAIDIGLNSVEAIVFAVILFVLTTILTNTIWKNVLRTVLVSAAAFMICFLGLMAWNMFKANQAGNDILVDVSLS